MSPKQILLRCIGALTIIGSLAVVSAGSAAASTGAPITVGFICSCTGAGGYGAFLVDAEYVYLAWAKSVNASGGINGHPVKVITEDDAGTPGTSGSEAQTLISDHVDAIVDGSLDDSVWENAVKAANIPVVGSNETSQPFGANSDFYPEGDTNDASLVGVAHVWKEAGVKKLADLYCGGVVTCLQDIPIFEKAGQELGAPVVYKAAIFPTAPNYDAECLAAEQSGANGVLAGQAGPINIIIGTDCNQQGYHPIYIYQGAGFGLNEASAPGLKTNAWSEFDDMPLFAKTPGNKAMNAVLDKYYPGMRENGELFLQEDAQAWQAGLLLDAAVKGGGLTTSQTPSAAEVLKGLDSLKGDTLGGMAPPLTFKAGQPHVIKCWFVGRIKNGVPSVINDAKVTCP